MEFTAENTEGWRLRSFDKLGLSPSQVDSPALTKLMSPLCITLCRFVVAKLLNVREVGSSRPPVFAIYYYQSIFKLSSSDILKFS